MGKLIALDDGHGMETPGKRTPNFTDGTKGETGKPFMHENEFNRAVIDKLDEHLKRCGFKTIFTAPGDNDVPLATREKIAEDAKADLFISAHANANTGVWGKWGGISTHIYPGSKPSLEVAQVIHKWLIKGTPLRDRGIVESNFYVLRETNMKAVLVECAFMDNIDEARLLMSSNYREEVALELANGICEYYKVTYIPEKSWVKPNNCLIDDGEFDSICDKIMMTKRYSNVQGIVDGIYSSNHKFKDSWLRQEAK